ncbi:RF-1 domain-containing protein [Lasiosphaeria hispida]|uniref:RF-1 domain-containing protein n=1 Tax=Lasiosphaeria hispida TaxID=260671 RepID=A0AAJ0HQ64_9PEZI|nr:RF-1 domain-containing protein [Lasiosphaeria hispida]
MKEPSRTATSLNKRRAPVPPSRPRHDAMLRPSILHALTGTLSTTARRHGAPSLFQPRLAAATAAAAAFTTSPSPLIKQMPARAKPPPDEELEEKFLRGSGPGGQKINKTSSAVQLKHLPTGIVLKCQATRSRTQNRKLVRELLAAKIDELENGAESRNAIVGDVKKKKADSKAKKARRKARKIEAEKAQKLEVAKAMDEAIEKADEAGKEVEVGDLQINKVVKANKGGVSPHKRRQGEKREKEIKAALALQAEEENVQDDADAAVSKWRWERSKVHL